MPIETLYVMIGFMGPILLITTIAAILAHLPDKKHDRQTGNAAKTT